MNCRSSRRNELERQGVRSAALNAWFGHSQAVAERHYEKVTEDDYAEVTNQVPSDVGQTVGQSGGTQEASVRITDAEKPIKKPLLVLSEGSRSGMEYTWVNAFRTSLCSNSQTIADFLRRFADLDLAA